jgi:TolB-like protein/Tfp pilus assembly protein PilF
MPDSTPTPGAVFLSYAREDTDAARRIADALRSHGVEAWFDQSELRGGDAWDAKIRKQINDCTLFLPIISKNTQGRGKGYFRLEWKLAVEQTHLMAEGMAFLTPVVVDGTPESGAVVPPEFMRVQWTRLPGALPTPQFVEQVKRLLSKELEAGRPRPAQRDEGVASPKKTIPGWIWGALTAVVVGIAVALSVSRKIEPPPVATSAIPVPSRPPAVDAKSIAVLPFANLSTDKENEFFADGVHDDVITNLAKIRDLKVISRTSVLAYRDPASRNLTKISQELGVATILEGSIRRVGSKVHMNAQLIDARTDEHLWADTFDGDTSDIFVLQAKLAQQIAAALKATLTPGEKTLIEHRPTENQEAYDLYLRARTLHQELGEDGHPEDYERVISFYEQAAAKDPSFALAHAQASLVHDTLYWFAYLDPSLGRAEKARTGLEAAVRLAPDLPETHLAQGAYYYRIERNWNRALAEFRAAESGLPNDAQLFFWLAVTHRRLGKWTDALAYFERAIALNPREVASLTNYCEFLVEMRRWGAARDATGRFLAYFPTNGSLLFSRAQGQFAVDGDRAAYAAAIAASSHDSANRSALSDQFRAAMLRDDFAAADRALADPGDGILAIAHSNVIADPPPLYRTELAFLRGEASAARKFGDEALAFYRARQWNPRQEPWVQMRRAMISAWMGDPAAALRDAQSAMATEEVHDVYDVTVLRPSFGAILISAGRREEALACLRQMMTEPCPLTPNEIRIDALWSRLKDDPRFEEILRSAKPL